MSMDSASAATQACGFFDLARMPAVRAALAAGLVVYFLYHATRFEPARLAMLTPNVDTSILYSRAREILRSAAYPARLSRGNFNQVFPYPPSAVLIFGALASGGERIFTAVWTLLMAAALLIALGSAVAGERGEIRAAWLALGALSLLFCDSPVAWDLRSGNSNLVYLGIVMASFALMRRRPQIAGALLGVSFSLKLYSGLLLLWLLLNGPKRALYAAMAVSAALWLVLPALIFGAGGALSLYAGWREQIRIVSGAWVYPVLASQRYAPPLITTRRAIAVLTGARPDAAIVKALLAAIRLLWIAAIATYAATALRCGRVSSPSRAALADWSILLIAPLPFSPWLETYHAVPLLPATILCLVTALDTRQNRRERVAACGALLTLLAIRGAAVPIQTRGLALMAEFFVITAAFIIIRPSVCFPVSQSCGRAAQVDAAGDMAGSSLCRGE